MNEKHYDNLCEIAERVGVYGAETKMALAMLAVSGEYFGEVDNKSCLIAALYNALDVLCIALDCEDEVQDMAEKLAESLASKA